MASTCRDCLFWQPQTDRQHSYLGLCTNPDLYRVNTEFDQSCDYCALLSSAIPRMTRAEAIMILARQHNAPVSMVDAMIPIDAKGIVDILGFGKVEIV